MFGRDTEHGSVTDLPSILAGGASLALVSCARREKVRVVINDTRGLTETVGPARQDVQIIEKRHQNVSCFRGTVRAKRRQRVDDHDWERHAPEPASIHR